MFITIPQGLIYSQQGEWIKYFHRGIDMYYKKISDSIYVSLIETTNNDYKMFLQNTKDSGDIETYYKCIPDSNCWITKTNYSFSKEYYENYSTDPTYGNYPVVNISFEAMNLYCSWLTERYKEVGKKYQKVIVRLPTEAEWVKFVNPNGYPNLPWNSSTAFIPCKKKDCTDSCLTANIKIKNLDTGKDSIGILGTGVVACSTVIPMKGSRFYDIIGNVSEMTSEGKPKGGSWDNYLNECYINKTQDFLAPDPRLGFRIIIEIIEF